MGLVLECVVLGGGNVVGRGWGCLRAVVGLGVCGLDAITVGWYVGD